MCDPVLHDANQVGYRPRADVQDVNPVLDDAIRSAAPPNDGPVFGRRAHLSPHFLHAVGTPAAGLLQRCMSNATAFASLRRPSFARCTRGRHAHGLSAVRRRDPRGRTRIAKSATCSTSSYAPSRTCTPRASTSAWSSPSSTGQRQSGRHDHQVRTRERRQDPVVSFQPVSFTGRDEDISDADRMARRYTLSHLAHDVKAQQAPPNRFVTGFRSRRQV